MMNRAWLTAMVVLGTFAAHGALAQEPIIGSMKFLYDDARLNVIGAAEKADASIYGFKPADETRTLAQQLAHIADTNYLFCSTSREIENPHPGAGPGAQGELEKSLTGKAEIVAAVRASFEFCDAAFEHASDANLAEMVELVTPAGSTPVPRASVLTLALYHSAQHYGSIATYFRLNGMVPPSTQRSQQGSDASP